MGVTGTDHRALFWIKLLHTVVWLARHNQAIFGTLFAASQLWLGVMWLKIATS